MSNYVEISTEVVRRFFTANVITSVILDQLLHYCHIVLLIRLYGKFGPVFVERLDGAFALATDGELILARDTVGLRPLFYGYKDNELYFFTVLCPLITCKFHE